MPTRAVVYVELAEIGKMVDEVHDCSIVEGNIAEVQRREGVLGSWQRIGEIRSGGDNEV